MKLWTREELEQRITAGGIKGGCWGRCGHTIANEIEAALGVVLIDDDFRAFADNVGNAIIGAFNVMVSGSEDGKLSCITESQAIRSLGNEYVLRLVKVMDHAGESYFCVSRSNVILCYDSLNVSTGMETQTFPSFRAFVEWLFREAAVK